MLRATLLYDERHDSAEVELKNFRAGPKIELIGIRILR
jgi:hypothetical protein